MNTRRSFLSGLATLPLIGGSIALIGRPTAVAAPDSTGLRNMYLGWLRLEHTRVMHDLVDREWNGGYREHAPPFAIPDDPVMIDAVRSGTTSAHAAVVLSAMGLDWRSLTASCGGLVDQPLPSFLQGDRFDPFRTWPAVYERKYRRRYQPHQPA